jgi:hypothetical protein
MLKTLDLKPPLLISKANPPSAPPGATVTIYGSGFSVPNFNIAVSFSDFPNKSHANPRNSRGRKIPDISGSDFNKYD